MAKKEITTKQNLVYKGKIISLYNDEIIASNGKPAIREYVTHPGGACVLGLIDEKIVFTKQYRYPYHEEILELPAGKIEKDEDPKVTAIREFEEETGYKAVEIEDAGAIYPSVGYTNEIIYLYIVRKAIKSTTHFDEDEDIDTILLSKEEVLEKINSGKIKDAKSVVLVYKYLF